MVHMINFTLCFSWLVVVVALRPNPGILERLWWCWVFFNRQITVSKGECHAWKLGQPQRLRLVLRACLLLDIHTLSSLHVWYVCNYMKLSSIIPPVGLFAGNIYVIFFIYLFLFMAGKLVYLWGLYTILNTNL